MPSSNLQEEISPELSTIIELVNGLSLDTQRDERLKTLKTLRANILPLSLEQTQRLFHANTHLNMNNLFYIFSEINNNTDDSTAQTDDLLIKNDTTDIFEKFLSSYNNIGHLLEAFNKELTDLYSNAGCEKLQSMCLERFCFLIKQVRCGGAYPLVNPSIYLCDLMPLIISNIQHNGSGYAALVSKFLCEIAQLNTIELHGPTLVFNSHNVNVLREILNKDSVQFFRIFEIIVALSSICENVLNNCESEFHLNRLIEAFLYEGTDILSKLNLIELLKDLAITKHGFTFLDRNSHLQRLITYLDTCEKSDDAMEAMARDLFVPAVKKLFGHLAFINPRDILRSYSKFFDMILQSLDKSISVSNENKDNICLSLEILTLVFKNPTSKKVVFDRYEQYLNDSMLPQIFNFIKYKISDVKMKAISLFESLMHLSYSDEFGLKAISQLNQAIFQNFLQQDANFLDYLLHTVKQPFYDTRIAILKIFISFFGNDWAVEYVFQNENLNAAFMQYLLDRSTELEKEGRLAKFDLVKTIVNLVCVNKIVPLNQLELLNRYVREGPFFMQRQAAVAFESS